MRKLMGERDYTPPPTARTRKPWLALAIGTVLATFGLWLTCESLYFLASYDANRVKAEEIALGKAWSWLGGIVTLIGIAVMIKTLRKRSSRLATHY
jgi:drug/metabolite transporter superfamily protein YnfA